MCNGRLRFSVEPPSSQTTQELIVNYDVTVESLSLYDLQKNGTLYRKTTAEWDQNQYIAYAAKISNNTLDFLLTLDRENGLWTPDRQSEWPSATGPNGFEDSWGFCQVHKPDHPEIVNDPRFFSDPYWQLDKCWELYQGGTRFYGADLKELSRPFFSR